MRPSSCGGAHRGSIDAATDATAAANPIAQDGEPSIAPEHSVTLEAKRLQLSPRSSFLRDLSECRAASPESARSGACCGPSRPTNHRDRRRELGPGLHDSEARAKDLPPAGGRPTRPRSIVPRRARSRPSSRRTCTVLQSVFWLEFSKPPCLLCAFGLSINYGSQEINSDGARGICIAHHGSHSTQ